MSFPNPPGGWPGAQPPNPPPYSPVPPIRYGIFPDINRFMIIPPSDEPFQLSFRTASVADLHPGRIIYIRDQQSRLDGRVMLVLRRTSAGFLCLTFCAHWIPATQGDHWQVRAYQPENGTSQRRNACLKVVLRPFANAPQLLPQDGITIHIGDFWNVENVVEVAVLGFVKHRHLVEIVDAVQRYFCESMNRALRELELTTRTQPAYNVRRRR